MPIELIFACYVWARIFIKAHKSWHNELMKTLSDKIHKLPKADVHIHLHLGGSIKALRKRYPKKWFYLKAVQF